MGIFFLSIDVQNLVWFSAINSRLLCWISCEIYILAHHTELNLLILVPAVIDSNANTLFLSEMARGMNLALKYFFDKKVTVSFSRLEHHSASFAPKVAPSDLLYFIFSRLDSILQILVRQVWLPVTCMLEVLELL